MSDRLSVTQPPPSDETDDDDVSRRRLIRLLVGLGVGVPVLVEGTTVLRLITSRLFGGGDGSGDGASATGTATPTERSAVGVGDELLAATAPTDTVHESYIRVRDSGWEFILTVGVENTTEVPCALRLGDVRTTADEAVSGGGATARIPPGESATVTGRWLLAENTRPETVTVTMLSDAEETRITEREVELKRIPLRG